MGRRLPALLLFVILAGCDSDGGPTGVDEPGPGPNETPTASFQVSVAEGPAPLAVTFDARTSSDPDGEIVQFAWDFGDGNTGTGEVVTHTYAEPGAFRPRLTVTDDRGARDVAADPLVLVFSPPGDGAGVVTGFVWRDRVGDGVRPPDARGIPGVRVRLALDGEGAPRSGDPVTVTDRDGRFTFSGVPTGAAVQVTQELDLGWTNTSAERIGETPAGGPAHAERGREGEGGSGLGAVAQGPVGDEPARIISGEVVPSGELSFMVALLRVGPTANPDAFTCGGTFVASRWILTAAHCVVNMSTGQLLPASAFQVLVGTRDLTSGGERVPVRAIRIFPAFNSGSFAGDDVAVLELEQDFLIPRLALQTPDDLAPSRPGTMATAAGWGRTTFSGSISTALRRVEMEVISNGECRRMLDETIVDATICAGLLGSSGSICSGDSGGPLMVFREGDWVQIGVTSFGRNCQPPMAFARVSAFREWIGRQIPAEASLTVEVDWGEGDTAEVAFGNFR